MFVTEICWKKKLKPDPKLVVEGCRVFQDEDVDESDGNDGIVEEEEVRWCGTSENELSEAECVRQWTQKVPDDVHDKDDGSVLNGSPANGWNESVDQGPFVVRAKLLEPDDSGEHGKNDAAAKRCKSDGKYFETCHFVETRKEIHFDWISYMLPLIVAQTLVNRWIDLESWEKLVGIVMT